MKKINYITPIQKQLNEKMHEVCNMFMLIGSPRETPRYYNFGGFDRDKNTIKIKSTQNSNLYFIINIDENLLEDLRFEVSEFWQQFKEYRTKFLLNNYPTINAY
jgi:hypothetical protein|tara:strand:+ start:780 stop:1091 length:312 start_codon:yes stop_codon:yes gene_type:complete